MPRSSTADLKALRHEVFERDGYECKWPGCGSDIGFPPATNPLEMAHLVHRGMGGSKERNTLDGCITLCRYHHSIFDGRDGSSNTKRELAVMFKAQIR